MVEVAVDSVRYHIPDGRECVIPKEKDGRRLLSVCIGSAEANASAR